MSTGTRKPTPTRATKKVAAPRKKATKTAASKGKLNPSKAPLNPAAPPAAEATVVTAPQKVIQGPVMRRKELIETVVTRTGMKKKDVKPVVEQMLAVMGEALADNREMNLQPFGRLIVRKEKPLKNGRVVVSKIRQTRRPADPQPDASPKAAGK